MFSFKSIAVFATLAFGAITSMAAPTSENTVSSLVARCGCDSVPTIIADVKVAVTPYVNELHYITASNCTVETLTPIVVGIKAAIGVGIGKLKDLYGQDAAVILASVDAKAVLDVTALATIVADLVSFIFAGINVCLSLNISAVISVIIPLFCSLCEVLGAFISITLCLCGDILVGLDVAIYAIIQVYAALIVKLNVTVLVSLFGIAL